MNKYYKSVFIVIHFVTEIIYTLFMCEVSKLFILCLQSSHKHIPDVLKILTEYSFNYVEHI